MDIRQRIEALLTEKGWGRKTLSKRMGVSDTFVRMFIENPNQQMGHENLIKAAEALGVTTDYLLHANHEPADAISDNLADDKNGGPNYLAEWREFRQLTQTALAELVGTNANMIGYLESGERGLSARWLRRLAVALHTSPGMLLDSGPQVLNTNATSAVNFPNHELLMGRGTTEINSQFVGGNDLALTNTPQWNEIEEIRKVIERAMELGGFSRRSLSAKAGLSESAIRDVLTRVDNPGITTLRKIAFALNLDPRWLILGSETLPNELVNIWNKVAEADKPRALAVLRAFAEKESDIEDLLRIMDERKRGQALAIIKSLAES